MRISDWSSDVCSSDLGIWLRPGQAKIVPADTNYGDATVTGEGCIFLELFGDHYGTKPDYDKPEEMAYWNEVHGHVLEQRDRLGLVCPDWRGDGAMGGCRKSR